MRGISIFAKPATYTRRKHLPYRHLFRGSSMIRGEQVAKWLGAKLNPTAGYEDDLCIYVKPTGLDHVRDGAWVDIVDGDHIVPLLQERPLVNVIVNGKTSHDLYRPLLENRMAVIEPHHCNFDMELRTRKEITTVGYIGGEVVFRFPLENMRELVGGIGLDFVWRCDYRTREDVVNFYRNIDIQLVWSGSTFKYQSRGPTKHINAASFGIPTVGYPQVCCQEVDGHYIRAESIDGAMEELTKLRDLDYYMSWATRVAWTEEYHISRRAELYRGLE